MLSQKDKDFLIYWQTNRLQRSKYLNKVLGGLPMAMLFGLPILLFVIFVRIFLPDWYTKISDTSEGTFIIIVIALFIFIFIFSFLRMHYKWEMNEQLYLEIKQKERKVNSQKLS